MSVLTSVSGFPRIGQNRELKKIIEAYWKGVATLDDVRATAKELRAKHWKLQQEAGIDLIPSNDFSYYDQMLDTAILLNVIPQRYQRLAFDNPEETLFAMGRGYQGDKGDVTALPMKKWFTTNYHYLVPEVDEATDIKLNSTKPFDEFNEAKALGITTKPVLIGPYTFLKLARNPQAEELVYDKGLVNAVEEVFQGASWQRCAVHLMRDCMREAGSRQLKKRVGRIMSPVFRAKDAATARAMYHVACDMLRDCCPKAADVAEEAEPDALAYLAFPPSHWKRLRTNNVQERANREIKRRSRVVQVFPSERSLERIEKIINSGV